MHVSVGSMLGPYQILAPIGAGGMGEVWKAYDTRLDRPVAIKFAHERFSDRFERESKAIARLNHPHICTLYDIGPNYLVMEYVEGEPLDARLKRGPIPIAQAIRFAAQIAGALAAAHAKGIVHRDLKPANIILTKSGAKVLDFGLAKAAFDQTITLPNTILGSPAYMAPEQREGREADHRTDIYALGLVLCEMVEGRRGAVLADPPYLAHIARNCLCEAAEDRWQSAADVQRQLEWSPEEPRGRRSRLPGMVAVFAVAALVAVAALAGVAVWRRAYPPSDAVPMEFMIALEKQDGSTPVPSPDGRLLAYRGRDRSGHPIVMLRPVNSIAVTPVSGTEGAGSTIFWSPRGDWIGFHAAGAIRKIRVSGGLSLKITETADLQDADWNTQGDIIFRASNREPLQRVRDSGGGNPQPLTKLNAALLENSHRFPKFLPGGRQFLFVTRCADRANNALYIGSLDAPEVRRVMFVEARVTYVNGRLIYFRDGALVAQNFDIRTGQATGDPRVIVSKVGYSPASIQAFFNVSNDGSVIVSSAADRVTSRLLWFDRNGQELGTLGSPGPYQQPRISPSGDRVLFEMPDPKTGNRDLGFIEVDRAILRRLTNHPANDWFPVWSPDGRQVAFGSDRVDGRTMFGFLKTSLDQSAPEIRIEGLGQPTDWSKDGWIAAGDGDIQVASAKSGERVKLTTPPGRVWGARFSPDSRWLAYSSDESGRSEIHVRAFSRRPEPSATTIQLSNNGGEFPMWNNTGTEVYYMSADNVVFAVDVRGIATGRLSAPVRLFRACPQSQPGNRALFGEPYLSPLDTRDGERFLAACLVDAPGQYTVLMHWDANLR